MLIPEASTDFEPLNARVLEGISTKVLLAAVDIKLFDQLTDSCDLEELAHKLGLVTQLLEPVMDILAGLGLVEVESGRYRNSSVAEEFLVSSAPLYQGDYLGLTMGFARSVENRIPELLAGGKLDREEVDQAWALEHQMNGTGQNALRGGVHTVADMAAGLPGFNDFGAMCDIGGNHGLYTFAVLERNAVMKGTIFDLPAVVEKTAARCEQNGYADRVTTRGIDFRNTKLPEGNYDLVIMSHVLYAFKQDMVGALQRVAQGLKPGGWFISHHNAGRYGQDGALYKASLELVTRLAGYASHFIEREELVAALEIAGFGDFRFSEVPGMHMGLVTAARKIN
ncbi:methyltransferase [Pseudodesulfovibrio sp.]|uniref:methyltransferase n=1 Tax=unclassified Pseudodesulfovibrio TaxID=2661612 RepID=UPI003B005332